jgi:hypothetical protein
MLQAAGALSWVLGLGFGIPAVIGARHLAATGEVWLLWGLPTYGDGPLERIGIESTVPLLVGFIVVCLAEVVTGTMLLLGAPGAVAASWVLLPFELAFWIGFALPFGPVLAVVRSVLVLLA